MRRTNRGDKFSGNAVQFAGWHRSTGQDFSSDPRIHGLIRSYGRCPEPVFHNDGTALWCSDHSSRSRDERLGPGGRYAPSIAFLYKAGSNSGTTWICWECPSSEADPALLRSVLEAGRHIAEKKTGLPDNGPMHAVFHQYHKKSCHSCSSSL